MVTDTILRKSASIKKRKKKQKAKKNRKGAMT